MDSRRTFPPPAAARRWLPRSSAAALLATLAALALPAAAAYPDKPIRLIVGQQPGSALDNAVRVITPPLSESLGQQVVIDNRAGAGGMIAMQIGLAAAPDGYTLVNAGSPQMIAPFLFRKLDYDLFRDFVPVARLTVTQNALVVPPSLAVGDVRSLIALLKAKPSEFNLASAGVGSASHLAGELFNAMTGVRAVHVPYKGGAAAVTALLGNEAQYLITPLAAIIGQIQAGRLKALAVGGETRAVQLPAVPTMEEAGVKGYRSSGWNGIFAPRGTPAPVVAKLADTIRDLTARPAIREQYIRAGVEAGFLAGPDFERFMREDMARFGAAVKAANLKPE
jgi:tripartite-type tricarboxylate transporter receptor subunit TctC